MEWNIQQSTNRVDQDKKEHENRTNELTNQRKEAQEKHTRAIHAIETHILKLKGKFWKTVTIGGNKTENNILKMKKTGKYSKRCSEQV